jgi:hypothetical protein
VPSHALSEGEGGVVRKQPPSILRFERGRVVVVCSLTFRVRKGVWLGNSPSARGGGVVRKQPSSVSRFERGRVVVVCRLTL